MKVTVSEDGQTATVTVSDNGPGIPNHELAVLDQGEETTLKHGSGIGLWIVQWILDNTAANIDYQTTNQGTDITVQFPSESRTR